MKSITVKASKTYEVTVGNGLINEIGDRLKQLNITGRLAVITDKKVNSIYLFVGFLAKLKFCIIKGIGF